MNRGNETRGPVVLDRPVVTTRCQALHNLLAGAGTGFLMEAHNGISARIAEEAGFRGIWASGLSLSAQFGVRDNNEASWTQIVDMLEFMSDATHIPILLDGDTGYGNFNNLRRLVRKLEQRGIAGVCIEDKIYPKTNSFINSERQPLADIEEFQGKIKAGKDSQMDDDFCLVARVEALVAGWGMDEALRRAARYYEAGADAILIHSRAQTPHEILTFSREWGNRCPLVIVPTSYYSTSADVFRGAGISLVIWANHLLRTAVAAMEVTARELFASESLVTLEERIAPITEVFRLQGASELQEAEDRYSRSSMAEPQVIVLAASRGDALGKLTEDRPKAMLPVAGKALLRRLVDEFKLQQLHRIHVVTGYKPESIDITGINLVQNPDHQHSGELASLDCVNDRIEQDLVITYGDLLFRGYILRDLLQMPGEIVVVVDASSLPDSADRLRDLAYCTAEDNRALFQQDVGLLEVRTTDEVEIPLPQGRWIGMLRARKTGCCWLREALECLRQRSDFYQLGLPDLLNHLIRSGHPLKVMYIQGHWLDINNQEDLRHAAEFAHCNPYRQS